MKKKGIDIVFPQRECLGQSSAEFAPAVHILHLNYIIVIAY